MRRTRTARPHMDRRSPGPLTEGGRIGPLFPPPPTRPHRQPTPDDNTAPNHRAPNPASSEPTPQRVDTPTALLTMSPTELPTGTADRVAVSISAPARAAPRIDPTHGQLAPATRAQPSAYRPHRQSTCPAGRPKPSACRPHRAPAHTREQPRTRIPAIAKSTPQTVDSPPTIISGESTPPSANSCRPEPHPVARLDPTTADTPRLCEPGTRFACRPPQQSTRPSASTGRPRDSTPQAADTPRLRQPATRADPSSSRHTQAQRRGGHATRPRKQSTCRNALADRAGESTPRVVDACLHRAVPIGLGDA